MKSYQYKGKYYKTIYFEFEETEMNIKRGYAEYNFKYQDIDEYNIFHIPGGFYRINFTSNNKKITEKRDDKITDISFLSIVVENNNEIPLCTPFVGGGHLFVEKNEDTNIRNIIKENTPFISNLDKSDDIINSITKRYHESTDNTMGEIHIIGPIKDLDNYTIKLNNCSYITLYTTKQHKILEQNGITVNELSKPRWIDNKTIAFKIPFGEWDISLTYLALYGGSPRKSMYGTTKNVHITINKDNNVIKLKCKPGLLKAKLKQI